MFEIIIITWGAGMVAYIALSSLKKYNHLKYYDVSNKIQRFKSVRDKVNSKNNGMFR